MVSSLKNFHLQFFMDFSSHLCMLSILTRFSLLDLATVVILVVKDK